MSRYWLVLCLFGFGTLFAEEPSTAITPELVESQLQKAEKDFQKAQEMFDPWYAGPLITGSAHICLAGQANIQPYLFYIDNYAHFDRHGKSHDISDLQQVNPVMFLQVGVLGQRVDTIVVAQAFYNKQRHPSVMKFGDTSISARLGLLLETANVPAVLIGVKETFPTGKFNHLSPHKGGVDATGSGAYTTSAVFNISKVVFWSWTHPMNLRLSLSYAFPSDVSVRNFNAYGGGYGTKGKVKPGQNLAADFGYEFSLTQRWVLALDVAYSYAEKNTFSGRKGVDSNGLEAVVGGPFNDQLSLAPAIEYNVNPNLGFIGGVWFSVWGRNSLNFVSGVITGTYTF